MFIQLSTRWWTCLSVAQHFKQLSIVVCRNSKICILQNCSKTQCRRKKQCFYITTVMRVTDRSTCRCGWTPGSELWDYEGLQVHAGSWERSGHFPPPGCQGYVGMEEACSSHPPDTPEAKQKNNSKNQCIKFPPCGNNGLSHVLRRIGLNVPVITYRLIFQFEMKHRLSFFVIFGDLCSLPYLLRVWDPNPSELKKKDLTIFYEKIEPSNHSVHANRERKTVWK